MRGRVRTPPRSRPAAAPRPPRRRSSNGSTRRSAISKRRLWEPTEPCGKSMCRAISSNSNISSTADTRSKTSSSSRAHFCHHIGAVDFDGSRADAEIMRDELIRLPLEQSRQHFPSLLLNVASRSWITPVAASGGSSRLSAKRMAARRRSPLNGFSKKSTAPCRIAATASGISPCAVMTITGMETRCFLSAAKRSSPLISGMRTSVTTQPESFWRIVSRDVWADLYVRTLRPSAVNSRINQSIIARSSSTIRTVGRIQPMLQVYLNKPSDINIISPCRRKGRSAFLPRSGEDALSFGKPTPSHAAFFLRQGQRETEDSAAARI